MLFDVKRFAVHDGPGVRTTLFLKGCPLRCCWCHNPESISPRAQLAYYAHKCIHCGECVNACPVHSHSLSDGNHVFDRNHCTACGACEDGCLGNALKLYGKMVTVEEAVRIAELDRDFYGTDGGVTLSGGEPLLQADFCLEVLTQLKQRDLHTAIDTCGYVAWGSIEKVLSVTDMFLWDFKQADSAEHKKLTGHGNELILDNLRKLSDRGARIEIRIPLVPGCNDGKDNLSAAGEIFRKLRINKVKILPYHALARSKYVALELTGIMPQGIPTYADTLDHAVDILKSHGAEIL